jgi:hypothetical protein
MSVSGFHHHFKAVTAMSPLQFQKRLRLLEARRLMLGEDLDAANAAYRVGYHDASHFNREYKSQIARPTDARCATAAGRGPRFPSPISQKAHPTQSMICLTQQATAPDVPTVLVWFSSFFSIQFFSLLLQRNACRKAVCALFVISTVSSGISCVKGHEPQVHDLSD